MDPTVHRLTALHAAEHRKRNRDPQRIAELREQIAEARIRAWVRDQLATAPPLSPEMRSRLAALLAQAEH